MTAPTPNAPTAAEGEWLGPVYRCDLCGLTIPATPQRNQREADDWHAYASTNCPGEGRMRLRGNTPNAPAGELGALSARAKELIGALTGSAAFVQSCEGDWINDALREWAIRKSDLSRYVAELESALLAARREVEATRMRVRRLETALVDHAASGAEIGRAVQTFRSFESRGNDFAAMLEVLDEYERNRLTREARPHATRPFPWRAVVNGPDDAQVVCGEHGNPSTFAQIAECHTAADAEFIVQACNAAALAATPEEK